MSQERLDIGVDIDGVMYDFGAAFKRYLHSIGRDTSKMGPPKTWTFYEDWGFSKEEFHSLVSAGVNARFIFMDGAPEPGTREALQRLRDAGHRIHIITDRSSFGIPGFAQLNTVMWLDEHEIPYDSLTFSADKTNVHTDFMIDDRLDNYFALDETACYPFLYDRAWNHVPYLTDDPRTMYLRRVRSLDEFVDEVLGVTFSDPELLPQADFISEDAEEPKESVLQEADRLVSTDRGKDYGHPFDDFSRTAKMWSGIFGIDVRPEQVPLAMVCVKISREINKPKRDNLVDIAGYAKTLDLVNERRRGMAEADAAESGHHSGESVGQTFNNFVVTNTFNTTEHNRKFSDVARTLTGLR